MEIINNKITQVILVQFNEVPLLRLTNQHTMELLSKRFEFNRVETLLDQSDIGRAIVCLNGLFRHEDGFEFSIGKLTIEERKFLCEFEGTSKYADDFFNELNDYLAELANTVSEDFLGPIVKAEESEIVAKLDFPIVKLIAPDFLKFMQKAVADQATSEIADAIVKPGQLAFNVVYIPKDDSLQDLRIALSRKNFLIGPGKGYRLDDRIYYSKAPFDTDTHIRLLQELEALFS